MIFDCRILCKIIPTVAYRTCADAGCRHRIINTRGHHQWLVSLKDVRCNGIHRQVGIEDARYLSINLLRKARRNPYCCEYGSFKTSLSEKTSKCGACPKAVTTGAEYVRGAMHTSILLYARTCYPLALLPHRWYRRGL